MRQWQLQEAKQQFSRVVDQARTEGPQMVTRHGKEVAVVLGVDEYRRLQGGGGDFREFLLGPPHVVADLPVERDRDAGPDIEL